MKTGDQHNTVLERIGALADKEEAVTDATWQWLNSTGGARQRYRQYLRMREVLQALPEPEISPDFVNRVLKQTGERGRGFVFRRVYATVAALVLLVAGGALYVIYSPVPPTIPVPVAAVSTDTVIIPQPDTSLEAAFYPDLADVSSHYGMTLPMMLVEEMPEEVLLTLLAESSLAGEIPGKAYEEATGGEPVPDFECLEGPAPSFVALFDFVDKLDKEEAFALNGALRTALHGA